MNSEIIIYKTQDGNTKVDILYFDGGNEIYFYLMPYWDGETDEFDVKSVEGFELLTNLEEVNYVSMCSSKLMEVFEESEIDVS